MEDSTNYVARGFGKFAKPSTVALPPYRKVGYSVTNANATNPAIADPGEKFSQGATVQIPPAPLHFHTCAECGVVFALAADVYLRRQRDREPIFCPVYGHANRLGIADVDKIDATAQSLQLLIDLRQARHEAEQLRGRLATAAAPPAVPVDDVERTRRVRFLLNRAIRADSGRLICRFCEATSVDRNALKAHFKRDHLDAIASLSAEYFNQP